MSQTVIQRHELVRKAIHLSSSLIPLAYWFLFDRDLMLKTTVFLASGFLLAEYLRFHQPLGRKFFLLAFGSALRSHEKVQLTGATYVFTGAVLTIFLFPKEIAVAALLVLSVSDTVAALIGIPFGRHSFLKKSLEGSVAFFLVTVAILWIFFAGQPVLILLTALLVTLAEAYPPGLDDNFLIPLLTGLLLSLPGLF